MSRNGSLHIKKFHLLIIAAICSCRNMGFPVTFPEKQCFPRVGSFAIADEWNLCIMPGLGWTDEPGISVSIFNRNSFTIRKRKNDSYFMIVGCKSYSCF